MAEFWDYEKLTTAERIWWDSIAEAAENDFYAWQKYICDLDRTVGYIHEPMCRFMTAPVLGDAMWPASIAEVDWVDSGERVKRGAMRGGDPFGEPFNRMTRLSTPARKRQLLRLPRGSYKTSLVAALILWLLRRDVNKSVMVMAADDDASGKILAYCDRHIRSNPKMAHYWRMNEWIAEPWTVMRKFIATRTSNRANDPSMWATSPGSVKAGPHPDYVIIDDIINEKTIKSDEAMEKANAAFDNLSPMLTKDSIVWVTGTPWNALDLYASLERRKLNKKDHMFDVYTRDSMNPDGTFWFKELLSEDFLTSKWIEAQESAPPRPFLYWSQFRMQPVTEAEQSLMLEKIDWVMQDEVDKVYKTCRRIGGVDPADEKASSGAWALWAWGTDANKHFWDVDLQKFSAKQDMVTVIARFAVKYNMEVLIIENTVISRRLIADLREKLREMGSRCAIIEVEPHSMNKARRIMEVENGFGGVMSQGRLHLRDNNQPIKNELRTFPGGAYTYDALDIASYITAWVSANRFYPRPLQPLEDPKPMTLDQRTVANYHESCDAALKRRDRLIANPQFRWTRPGIREAVTP